MLESCEPTYDNGFYRLNFHGRVNSPSVKNFQMIQVTAESPRPLGPHSYKDDDSQPLVMVQFGKLTLEERFIIDFRAPITPFQAFALALSQFNL